MTKPLRIIGLLFGLTSFASFQAQGQAPAAPASGRCGVLAQTLQLPQVTITSADEVAAGALRLPGNGMGPPMDVSKLPAFCRIAATAKPTADSDIRFEVWMPLSG